MKCKILFFICFILLFLVSCSTNTNILDHEEICNLKNPRIICEDEYYKILESDTLKYCYCIYNSNKEIVFNEVVETRPIVEKLNDNIVDISFNMGTGIVMHKYYSFYRQRISEDFIYVIANSDELIAYIDVPKQNSCENRRLIVQNVFDQKTMYRSYNIDFALVDTPVLDAEFSINNLELKLTYLNKSNNPKTLLVNLK